MAADPAEAQKERFQKAWAKMGRGDRRRVLRAVNRMHALEEPAEAALAVEFARRQRRMWLRWWWVLPFAGTLFTLPRGWEAAVANAVVGALFVGLLASAFTWRAGRSARLNQEVVDASTRNRRSGSPKKRSRAKQGSKGKRKGGRR